MTTRLPASTTSDSITYQEPTYQLRLSPLHASKAVHSKDVAHKSAPYQSLDALVDQVMQERYGSDIEGFSPKELRQHRKEVAFSLMNRSDQTSALKIELPLAKQLGLVEAIKKRLGKIVTTKKDLTPLAEFVFSSCKEENFDRILLVKIDMLLGPKSPHRNALFDEVCLIRDELRQKTAGAMKYYRPTQTTDGTSYLDHKGERVVLSQAIPSSYDRSNPHVQNGRFNLNKDGHVIYSAGRIETRQKAYEVLFPLIQQTFVSGQIDPKHLVVQPDGSYLYPVVVENLIGSPPIAKKERRYLLEEDEVLKSLTGEVLDILLPSGKRIQVKLQLMHFSTQTNYNAFFGQRNEWSSTGADVGERITKEGTASLRAYYEQLKPRLSPQLQTALELCFAELETSSKLQDRFILRAFISEMLGIPYHIHCKSSKDRTAVVAAIKKGLHQWLDLMAWSGNYELPKIQELLKDPAFRELTEAAFFENLPMTDQGVGITGVLDGKLYTQDRGFNFRKSLFEHGLPAHVLSDRYLYKASIVERILYTAAMSIASLLLTPIFLALTPVILGVLYYKFKGDFWEAYKYLLLTLILLPLLSGPRRNWLDRNSDELKARDFFLQHKLREKVKPLATHVHLNPKELGQAVDNLSITQYDKLNRFLQTGDPTIIAVKNGTGTEVPDETLTYILKELGNNWQALQTARLNKRLQVLVDAAKSSHVVLFKIQDAVTAENLQQFYLGAGVTPSTAEALPLAVTGKRQFDLDFPRNRFVVKTGTRSVPFSIGSSSRSKFEQTLLQLPPFKHEKKIPDAVLDFLTQKTTFSVFGTKYLSTISDQLLLSHPRKRLLTIEGSSSHSIDVYVEEDLAITAAEDPHNPVGWMHCRAKFTLTFDPISGWTASLAEMDPVRIEWANVAPVLDVHACDTYDFVAREYRYSNTIMLLKKYVEAIAVFADEKTSVTFESLTKEVTTLLDALSKIPLTESERKKTQLDSAFREMLEIYKKSVGDDKKKIIRSIIEQVDPVKAALFFEQPTKS